MSHVYDAKSLHGKVINYNQIKNIPSRNAFLDKGTYDKISEDISTGETLTFMPNDLHETHLQDKKFDKSKYCIIIFGVLLDGRRATVVIKGIQPYFEVMLPEDEKDPSGLATKIYDELLNLKNDDDVKIADPENYEIFKAYKFKGYSENRRTFAKFYFNKLKTRKEALKYVIEQGYETTSDDFSCYYRVVCRDHLTTFSTWVDISNYKIRTYSTIRGTVFEVDISDFKKNTEDITKNPLLMKDNLLSMCWDIETFSPSHQVPEPEYPDHKMFMIGITFQWHHDSNQLLRLCLVDHPCDAHPDYLTIVCEDEKKLIKAFGKIVFKLKPDINIGFNDAVYDWKWLIERGKTYKGVLAFLGECFDSMINWKKYADADVYKYNYKLESVKLEAGVSAEGRTLVFPGYINIDVRTVFRQIYSTEEKSNLNFYLSLNKLGGKIDMPYLEMFRIYADMTKLLDKNMDKSYSDEVTDAYNNLKTKMKEVAHYCVIDSQRCHELMKIRSVLMDRREVSNMSFTSVRDSFYRANGMKVRNIVIAEGQQKNMRFSNLSNNGVVATGKYPGGHVVPPEKGIVTSKLSIPERIKKAETDSKYKEWLTVTAEQMSEYNSIIEEHGPIINKDIIEKLDIKKCFTDFLLEHTGRPITGLDFSSLYPSLIMAYNLSPEYIITDQKTARKAAAAGHNLHKIKFEFSGKTVRGWSIKHDNKYDPDNPGYKFGIYPMILKKLFDARSIMKKQLHKYENEKEKLELLPTDEFNKPETKSEYETVIFNFKYIDSKQKALKVFMNTFYGELGNKRSAFFVVQLAGAITTAGQYNIKMVQKYVEEIGCKVYYGDSVTGDTPLLLRNRNTGQIIIKTIDNLDSIWQPFPQFKLLEYDRVEKEHASTNYQIWSEGNWRDIRRVIRHKTKKRMFRVNTYKGCIDVTEDHSLMGENRQKIKPTQVKVGDRLMHSFPKEFVGYNFGISEEEAYILGMFMGNGKCTKNYWCIMGDPYKLSRIKSYYKIRIPNLEFLISHQLNLSKIELINGDRKTLITKYMGMFYQPNKVVPFHILNSSFEIRHKFLDGFLHITGNYNSYSYDNKLAAQCMYYLLESLYITVNIIEQDSIYILRLDNSCTTSSVIQKIVNLPNVTYDTYVYDIETSQGSFVGGVGSICCFNTDSIYNSMPEKHFSEIDKLYYTGKISKLDYWTEQVNITFNVIKSINTDVNQILIDDNGTIFLKMAFEESLFPVTFLAKKKYYGIPHISVANFNPKELFIRGLEIKKRGVSEILRKICGDIMWDSVNINNIHTLIELVTNKIDEIYKTKWDFNDFIMTGVYKPNKQNVSVQNFAKRMISECVPITPYERFSYVIVKKNPFKYDERGRKKELQVGDKMEFSRRAAELNMSIDLDYYMKGSINGQLARLITYHDSFQVDIDSIDTEELKKAEKKTYDNACKWVDTYCKCHYTNYKSKDKIYKKIFTIANNVVKHTLKDNGDSTLLSLLSGVYDTENLEEWLDNKAEKTAIKSIKNHGKLYVDSIVKDMDSKTKNRKIIELQNIYYADKNSLLKMREVSFKNRRELLLRKIRNNVKDINVVFNYNNNLLEILTNKIKSITEIDESFNEINEIVPEFDDLEHISKININDLNQIAQEKIKYLEDNKLLQDSVNKLLSIYINMVSNYNFIHKTRYIVEYLKSIIVKQINRCDKPTNFNTKKFIQDNINDIISEMSNN
jgi:DNA polymerase elongation subunit (family B)